MDQPKQTIGVVVIGRNEGERLQRCLRSVVELAEQVVYVDSGSTDGSVDFARSLGVTVHELDSTKPFSMARARNAGAAALNPRPEFLQFVDGDCEVVSGWMEKAREYLLTHEEATVVCGRRRERFPEHSVFNRLCDIEWNTPVGEAQACGGDAMYRAKAFFDVEGFDEKLVAGEEPELCFRIRRNQGKIFRLDEEMTLHDANILKLGAWWKRTLRSGFAAADVLHRWGEEAPPSTLHFHKLARSAHTWSIGWLGVTLLFAIASSLLGWTPIPGLLAGMGLFGLQALRIARSVKSRSAGWGDALAYGLFTMMGKWPQCMGIRKFNQDLKAGKVITLIEYK